jgi:hypothetical protein
MALGAVLVCATPYRLIYLLTNASTAGTSLTIANDGGASPDLRTDANTVGGPIAKVMNAGVTGIGTVAATAMTQAQARNLLLEDRASSIGNELVPRCRTTIEGRSSATSWVVDANVDAQGDPILNVVTTATVTATAYLQIWVQHSMTE